MAKTLSKLFFGCAIFCFSCAAFGQGDFAVSHIWQFFRSDKARIETAGIYGGWSGTIIVELEDGREKIIQLEPPPDFSLSFAPSIYCINDRIFLILNDQKERKIELFSVSAFSIIPSIKDWELVGVYEYEYGDIIGLKTEYVVPYKEGKYLFVISNIANPEPEKRQAVKFVEATLKDKAFTLGEFIEIEYDGHGIVSKGPLGAQLVPRVSEYFPGVYDGWTVRKPILMDGYVVLASLRSGYFWILDTKTGKMRETMLYRELTIDQIRKPETEYASIIVSLCPAPDGSIIIAARPKKFAVRDVKGLPNRTTHANATAQEYYDARLEAFRAEVYSHPEIEWWKLDLEKGEFSPMAAPEAAPTAFEPGTGRLMQFRVHPDGSVSMVGGW